MELPSRIFKKGLFFIACCTFFSGLLTAQSDAKAPGDDPKKGDNFMSDSLIYNILQKYPSYFDEVLRSPDQLGVQVIYTQIDRDKKGRPSFIRHRYGADPGRYFYPASTVKLPVAVLALQRLNELKIAGLNKNSTMITGSAGGRQTEVTSDSTAPDGRPSIAHYIKKILLVSDNDAFNRLYEFLGQEYINNTLHRMGYKQAQLIHRLEVSLSEEENRFTNPVRFLDNNGNLLYEKLAEKKSIGLCPTYDQTG